MWVGAKVGRGAGWCELYLQRVVLGEQCVVGKVVAEVLRRCGGARLEARRWRRMCRNTNSNTRSNAHSNMQQQRHTATRTATRSSRAAQHAARQSHLQVVVKLLLRHALEKVPAQLLGLRPRLGPERVVAVGRELLGARARASAEGQDRLGNAGQTSNIRPGEKRAT
jgi:hypothetical protein